jgi:hypothetical protein
MDEAARRQLNHLVSGGAAASPAPPEFFLARPVSIRVAGGSDGKVDSLTFGDFSLAVRFFKSESSSHFHRGNSTLTFITTPGAPAIAFSSSSYETSSPLRRVVIMLYGRKPILSASSLVKPMATVAADWRGHQSRFASADTRCFLLL